jgi:peroxiredoxin
VRYNFAMTIFGRTLRWLGANKEMTHIVAGNMAPEFSLKALDGTAYALQKLLLQGPAVAAFFKVSCPVCQFTFPFLERIYKRYGGDGLTFLGISQDAAPDTRDFAKEFGVTFPTVLDEKGKGYPASNAYGLTSVPTIFFIETDGTVKVSCTGFDKKDLESIARELAERRKIPPAALFRPNESVPDHKPG